MSAPKSRKPPESRGSGLQPKTRGPHLRPSDRARRTRTALPLAVVCFTVPYVALLTTVRWIKPMGDAGWDALAYLVSLLFLGAALVVVVIPIVVFTLGRKLDAATRRWATSRAAMAFGGAGLALGLVAAAMLSLWGGIPFVGGIANVALPATVAGLATRLLLPAALAHRWVLVLAWVLTAIPVTAVVALVISLSRS